MKMLSRSLWLLALFYWSTCSFAATFERGATYYEQEEFEQAYNIFYNLSGLGNCRAQFNIAVMHVRGEHAEKDPSKAMAWARLAEQNGCEDAAHLQSLLDDRLDESGRSEARKAHLKLNEIMGPEALTERRLPTYLERTDGHVKPARPAHIHRPKYPRNMARKGSFGWVDVQFVVGRDGIPRHYKVVMETAPSFGQAALEAVAYARWEPALIGNSPAVEFGRSFRYVFQMENTALKASNLQSLLDGLKLKAETGGSSDKLSFAVSLSGFQSALKSIEGADEVRWDDASHWYLKAAQDGSALAKYQLGLNTLSGDQCDVSYDKSLFWLSAAADQNVLDAQFALGYELLSGTRFQRNTDEGWRLLRNAADLGLVEAQVELAWLLATYPDTDYRDAALAAAYLKKVDLDEYADLRTYRETEAAVAIAQQDWSRAKRALRQLTRFNKRHNTQSDRELALTQALGDQKAYFEPL